SCGELLSRRVGHRFWQGKRFHEPGDRLAARRVDYLVAELQRAGVDAGDSGQNVKSSPGAQLGLEGGKPARRAMAPAGAVGIAEPDEIEIVARRVREPVEIVGDGEVLDDVALPRVDHAAIGLEPIGHLDSLVSWPSERSERRAGTQG